MEGSIRLKPKQKNCWQLFLATFQLSAFTFGGGYVIVPLMKKQFVEKLGWLDERQMLDFVAIAQSAPGALAVNAALLVGYLMFGLRGAVISLLATIAPPLILLSAIAYGYSAVIQNALLQSIMKGMAAGVCAMILDVVLDMASAVLRQRRAYPLIVMLSAFVAVAVLKINVVWVILVCATLGLLKTFHRRGAEPPHGLS